MKQNTLFECSNCGAQFTKWTGRCLECGKWGTISENKKSPARGGSAFGGKNQNEYATIKTTKLMDVKNLNEMRLKTGIGELDMVLEGGIVPGSLILLGGEPGIGKSTLALQLANIFPKTLYVSGEESVEQIKLRANRLRIESPTLELANETTVEAIGATIKEMKPALAIVDSVQTMASLEAEGEAGNLTQVRACTVKLMECAKTSGIPIILIGQVTKEGSVAGPKALEHLVDTVLYLEGDRYHDFRLLRAAKNRFGSTDEVGIFTMEENGLREVKNPSGALLAGRQEGIPGTAVTCLLEGTRPLLIEIQALVTKTSFGYPQRRASGFDLNRLQVLIGVLTRRAGLPLDSYDVFLNVVGGVNAQEPAADLAVVLAIASAIKNKTLPKGLVAFGEVGLGGEVRPVAQMKKRLDEAAKLGLEFAVTPLLKSNEKTAGLKTAPLKNVKEIVEKIIQ